MKNTKKKKKKVLESQFKKKVCKDLGEIPELYYFVKEALALRGIPDIIICYKGCFVAWELKRSSKESTTSGRAALQKYILGLINKAGGVGRFVYPENYEAMKNELLSLK